MFFMAAMLVLDAQTAQNDWQTYEKIHDVSMDEYVRRNYWMAVVLGAGFVISLLPFVDRKRAAYWKVAAYIAAFTLTAVMIYAFGRWAAAGFDH